MEKLKRVRCLGMGAFVVLFDKKRATGFAPTIKRISGLNSIAFNLENTNLPLTFLFHFYETG